MGRSIKTFPDPHTRRLLCEPTNCGKNAANPMGLMKRTGISRNASCAISLTYPATLPAATTENVRGNSCDGVALKTAGDLISELTKAVVRRYTEVPEPGLVDHF